MSIHSFNRSICPLPTSTSPSFRNSLNSHTTTSASPLSFLNPSNPSKPLNSFLQPARQVFTTLKLAARAFHFWTRVLGIYIGFKQTQARLALFKTQGPARDELWKRRHEIAARDMWNLCVDLRGFYVKAGQFIATRFDFVPAVICKRLARLMDDVPGMNKQKVEAILCREFHVESVNDVFDRVDTENYIGSASVAQVHHGILKDGTEVAIKVQHENSKKIMLSDLWNLKQFGYLLQNELNFDLVSPLKELKKQIKYEFDFKREAKMMDSIGQSLAAASGLSGISIPTSIPRLVTEKVLVMTFLPGLPLTRLDPQFGNLPKTAKRIAGRKILKRMASAFGYMIFMQGRFSADPHPGNILVQNKALDIGILDFGQVKELNRKIRKRFAKLVIGMAERNPVLVDEALKELGVQIELESKPQEAVATATNDDHSPTSSRLASVLPWHWRRKSKKYTLNEKLAYTMFDTAALENVPNSPFDESSVVREARVKKFPKDLFFLLRTIQIMRGIAAGMDNGDFSLAKLWKPLAMKVVAI